MDTENEKPECPMVGEDGNIFCIVGRARRVLKRAGQADKAEEMIAKVEKAQSYDEALRVVMEYVEPV